MSKSPHTTPFELVRSALGDQPQALPVWVEVHRDVNHFSGLTTVVEGFQSLDALMRTEFDLNKGQASLKADLLDERASLQRFRVNSDPVAEVLAHYPWLSVLVLALVVVRDYQRFKDSAGAMLADAKRLIAGIGGISKAQREKLEAGVKILMERLLAGGEDSLRHWADKLHRARRALSGPEGTLPTISLRQPSDGKSDQHKG
ncbi:hypothetical protein [Hydrogenophaga sp. 5NK40-0174]|uniref:hypothetical protein n=1 Tax=Hydrogenophaga sp. 5NK40-0174 TaxID=3127649 RepID=UPI0031039780